MWIHTVVAGDTLRQIAERYGTTTRELDRLNELSTEDILVPGLHLLVPGEPTLAEAYTVQSGDTFTTIANARGTTPAELESWTGLRPAQGDTLTAGAVLYLPRRVGTKRSIEVNAYLIPGGDISDANAIRDVGAFTYLSLFSYEVRADGTLQGLNDRLALQTAKQLRIAPLMTVTNFDGNNFNPELAHSVFTDASLRQKIIDAILNALRTGGYRGVNVDFEHMRPDDRPLYNTFIRDLGRVVRRQGFSLSIAMGPKTADMPQASWMGAFDYRALGAEVDFLMLMTYEWGWVGGPPMAVAPLNQVRAVLNYATSQMRPEKILMGMALYGYDWTLPYPSGLASSLSNNSAQNLAILQQTPIQWDPAAASPWFRYRTASAQREVWFEDALSVAAKFQLVYELGLRGVSYWVLPNSFPQNWYLLRDSFVVKKV